MKINALIPARSGSVRVPNKNIRDFCGKPLMVWAIEEAFDSEYFQDVFVSTDNEEYSNIASKTGCAVIDRGYMEKNGEQPMYRVVGHAITEMNDCDAIALLQPTSPFRDHFDIQNAVNVYNWTAPKCLYSVCDKQLYDTGFIYIFDKKHFLDELDNTNRFDFVKPEYTMFLTSFLKSLQIDTEDDLKMCEVLKRAGF